MKQPVKRCSAQLTSQAERDRCVLPYAGTYGLPGRRQSLFPVREWPKRWGDWASNVGSYLWGASSVDYDAIPDPPREATNG